MPLAAVYVRVSSAEQVEGYSLDSQRHAAEAFCRARDYTLIAEYADEGLSAHTDDLSKRPAFARMLRDAEQGRFSLIVVHKMDRFARNLRACLEYLEQLGKQRVGVVSVSEPNLDYSTPQGFLFLAMLGALAEWYSRNLSEETKKGWAGRKRAGLWAGRLPFGVRKGEDGIPEPDPATHPGLMLAFERAAAGATDSEVAAALNAAGYRPNATARRAVFGRDAVRTILANRFYVGELPVGHRGRDGWLPAKHAPIVPADLFETVGRRRRERAAENRVYHVNHGRQVHALSGLVRCASCGEPMQQQGKFGRLMCRGQRQGGACIARSVHERIIEDELGAYLRAVRLPPDVQQRIILSYQREQPKVAERAEGRARIESQLTRLADLYVLGDLEKAAYEARRASLRAELARHVEHEPHARPDRVLDLIRYLTEMAQSWTDAPAEARNRIARALFAHVTVADQRLASVQPRPEFQPFFVLAGIKETPAPSSGAGEGSRRRARGDVSPHPRTSLFQTVPVAVR